MYFIFVAVYQAFKVELVPGRKSPISQILWVGGWRRSMHWSLVVFVHFLATCKLEGGASLPVHGSHGPQYR